MKGLYIHIPFCKQICTYCDFPKQIARSQVQEEYIGYLIQEIRGYKNQLKDVRSVYIGGGTPNSLSIALLERLLEEIKEILVNSSENTIEINSELLTYEQVKLFKKYHLNRVSIGVQTFKKSLIDAIHRGHSFEQVKDAIRILKAEGIKNINLDMMYGLPGQSLEDVKQDVELLFTLNIQHVSYYSLILEEKTILSYQIKHHQITLPDDDYVADMADYITQTLKKSMFFQYEISNYALPGYESIHNIGYWKCEEYIGVGAGACSFIDNIRTQNQFVLPKYYMSPILEKETLSLYESKQEYMMLGFRMTKGVSKMEYFTRFQSHIEDDFDLGSLFERGLIEEDSKYIRIRPDKLLLGNLVFEEFVR